MRKNLAPGLALLLLGAAPALWAQIATGNLYGKVVDESGAVLPGATVTLTGANIGTRATVAAGNGEFRFLSLDPGTYRVSVALPGFSTVNRDVMVATGTSVTLDFPLKVRTVEEAVTVTAETPIVDTKKTGTSTTMGKEELSKIPNSRDPWAVLRAVPGVQIDRMNQAGSESGQQSGYIGKGSTQQDSMWVVDGVVISDPAAAGASPTYFDFDAFEEVSVTTGGSDIKVASGGVGINIVTKRGTNKFHGSLGGFLTHDRMQSSNLPDSLVTDSRLALPGGGFADNADHIDQLSDYGADIGGPILPDRLWFWGSYGVQDLRIVKFNQLKDKTLLKNYSAKVNWQATSNNMFSTFYYLGNKEKFGRPAAGSLSEEATHPRNQGGAYPSKLHGLVKVEDNHVFSPNFMANVRYSYYSTGFSLSPIGGLALDERYDNVARRAFGSADYYQSIRPQHTANADFNVFSGSHELKFGFGYRKASVTSTTTPPGGQVRALIDTRRGPLAVVRRESVSAFGGNYVDAYIGDTYTKDRLTLNLGARWDRQTAKNTSTSAKGNALYPQLLPDLTYDGSGQDIKWNDISPRLGITYALDAQRKSLLRGSFAIFTNQLAFADVTAENPVGGVGSRTYRWNDRNGDGFVQNGEVDVAGGEVLAPVNAELSAVNRIDPNYKAPRDMEVLLGLDRQLAANIGFSVTGTFRRQTRAWYAPFIGVNGTDWVSCDSVTENGFTAPCFTVGPTNEAALEANNSGQMLTNRPGYSRRYLGAEAVLQKRLADKWMARVAVSYNDWTEHFDGTAGIQNPNPTLYDSYGWAPFSNSVLTDAKKNGGQIGVYSSGSGTVYWVGGKWQLSASALYQLPADFEIAGNLFGRQGYIRPINITVDDPFGDPNMAADVGSQRLPNIWNLDLRLAKNFRFGGAGLTLTADAFNVFNSNTVLRQVDSADSAVFNRIDQIMNPRIARIGVKFTF
jgi:carboxypeptidase family protein/TonB-dependent receptor-like protein